MGRTTIEWTAGPNGEPGRTWNPVRGCSRVSDGCRNCYAERQAMRFAGEGQYMHGFVEGGKWTGRVELVPAKLDEPLRWRKPARVFVNSMSDLFHESLSFEDIDRVFAVMSRVPKHTFQVLTKRHARMLEYLSDKDRPAHLLRVLDDAIESLEESARLSRNWPWPLPNVWLGVSVEDQESADARIPVLLGTPAAVRFVSYEPALVPVDFCNIRVSENCHEDVLGDGEWRGVADAPPGIDWLIVGGESGPGARPCDIAWVRNTVRQCRDARMPVFVKHLGSRPVATCQLNAPIPRAVVEISLDDRKGGNMAEWPEDLRVREFPEVPQCES